VKAKRRLLMKGTYAKPIILNITFMVILSTFLFLKIGVAEGASNTLSIDSYNKYGAGANDLGLWTGWGSSDTSTVEEVYLHKYVDGGVNNVKKFTYDCTGEQDYCWDASNLWNGVTYLDVSEFDFLSFRVKGETGSEDFYIEMQYGTPIEEGTEPATEMHSSDYFTVTNNWKQVNLPLAAFMGLDKTKMRALVIKFDNALDVKEGVIYLENLQFSNAYGKPESTGPVRIDREARTLIVDNEPYSIKGVGYQPTPIGGSPPNPDNPDFYDRDFPLLVDMGCNTIRAWGMPGINILNKAEEYGIKVIAGFWMDLSADFNDPAVRDATKQQFTSFVNTYKDSPALLVWAIGNENNYHNGSYADYYGLCNELAEIAYQIEGDSYHPVIIVNGNLFNMGVHERDAEDLQLNYIDAWGCNVYLHYFSEMDWNGDTRDFFEVYGEKSLKPLIITEYGADAFYTTNRWSLSGYEDETIQADWVQSNVLEIKAASTVCSGSTIMAYSDEWWKYPNGDNFVQDRGGFYTGDWGDVAPDDYANEEYWGLVRIAPDGTWGAADGLDDVQPRQVYYTLQSIFTEEDVIADFTASPTSGIYPLMVNFTDQSTGDITTWQWDFGDMQTSTQQNPTHIYNSVGTYTVSLTVTGAGVEDTETKTDYITVTLPPPPSAEFTADSTSGNAPLTVNFTDQSTGLISNWSWDFGDTQASTEQNPTHVYATAGSYTVTLTVTGPGGSDGEVKTDYIAVFDNTPVADFTSDVTTGESPLTVAFADLSMGSIDTWLWDFGDTQTSAEQNPVHVYSPPGIYDVSLDVTGPGGNDAETKPAYIAVVDTTMPVINITSPENNTGVDTEIVTVEGTVFDVNLLMVEVRTGYGIWEEATVMGNSFTHDINIPADGTLVVIESRATDASGNTSTDSVSVINGYMLFIELPRYYNRAENSRNLSSIAVVQDILDHMRPDEYGMPTENEIYNHGHVYNLYENVSLEELDPRGIEAALCRFDVYDEGYSGSPFGNRFLGYNFGVHEMDDTQEGFNDYLKDIVHWLSFPVTEGRAFFSDGSDVLDNPYTPAAVPLYGNIEGYNRWIVVNGCASDISPFEYNTQPWKYAYNISDITVYGLFLTDPDTSGIGQDLYVAASSLQDYLKPLNTEDRYDDSYVLVAEPPDEDFSPEVIIASPIINESTLRLVEIAECKDADMLKKRISSISWKEIIDPMLLLSEDFKAAIENSVARELIKVQRLDTKKEYYIIPFDKYTMGEFRTYAAIIVDAQDGHFMQASYVKNPAGYLQITKEDAIKQVKENIPDVELEDVKVRLVWEPTIPNFSPFYPYWEVSVGNRRYYIMDK
jgi:PKD repeat protein